MVLGDLAGQVSSADSHLLSRAKEKTQGLISLIGDLLDLSRIESGVVCQDPKPVMLDDLLENIIDFLSTRAASKHQSLLFIRTKSDFAPVNADPLALESIFGNLITNAINYTPDYGRIEVKLDAVDEHLKIQVIDNGFGIEKRHIEKIFERFYRVKNEKTRYITGTGLGLPIVKGLVDALKGSISVKSMPDEGSIFTVQLPVGKKSE
jgi:signal transduction histidine kinase